MTSLKILLKCSRKSSMHRVAINNRAGAEQSAATVVTATADISIAKAAMTTAIDIYSNDDICHDDGDLHDGKEAPPSVANYRKRSVWGNQMLVLTDLFQGRDLDSLALQSCLWLQGCPEEVKEK